MRIGAIEAGGTKFVCGIGNEDGDILDSISFPTGNPERTVQQAMAYFRSRDAEAIGIGSFGPIGLHPDRPDYGFVTETPKTGWSGFDFLGTMKREFIVPIGWDTDVNAAALGEASWGAASGLSSCVYITVGTGIGVGVYTEGRLVHGLLHPEGGHMLTRRHPMDGFRGICPFHGDCLEGMAAGPALEARWQVKGSGLPPEHEAWTFEAFYLGQAVANVILMLSPAKVILGGGVMQQPQLLPMIRGEVRRNLNGYVKAEELAEGLDSYVVPPGLDGRAGLSGALALGLRAWRDSQG